MQYNRLGQSSLRVSQICLGTMMWGQQNSEAEAHQQLDLAVSRGINFIDTAELYPAPANSETQGRTEQYLGNWLMKSGIRNRLVIASKVCGPGVVGGHIRENPRLNAANVNQALEQTLNRLQTNYVDLYQLHWPERETNYFGRLGYAIPEEEDKISIYETLEALQKQVEMGKIRHIGICNETPWGMMQYLRLAERHGFPKIVSIQNPYNLLNRSFEAGLAEFSHREDIPLIAYSPLAFGVLSGKYLAQAKPVDSRVSLYPEFSRYMTQSGIKATQRYVELAKKFNLSPAQLAFAFVISQPFVASTIVGASKLEQLTEDIDCAYLDLPDELYEQLEIIHREFTYPCP